MATKTLYVKNAVASGSNHGSLQDGGSAPGAGVTATGWTVGTVTAVKYARMDYGVERASTTLLASPVEPNSGPDNTLGDCWRTEVPLTGTFAAANWTFRLSVIGVTRATSTHDGRLRIRVWRGTNPTGAGATEITTTTLLTSAFTDLSNTVAVNLTVTAALAAATLTAEYLFVQVAFELTGAGSNAGSDVLLRTDSTNSLVTTSDFAEQISLSGTSVDTTSGSGVMWRELPLAGTSTDTSSGSGALAVIAPRTWGDTESKWGDWAVTWDGTPRDPDRSVNITLGTGSLSTQKPLKTNPGLSDTFTDVFHNGAGVYTLGTGTLGFGEVPVALSGTSTSTSAGSGFLAAVLQGTSISETDGAGTLTVPADPGAPDAILTQTNLAGLVDYVQDDPTNPGPQWLTAIDPAMGIDIRFSFPTPATPPGSGGPTRMSALLRRIEDPSAPDPTVTLELWESGVFRQTLASNVAVTSTEGQIVAGTMNPALLSDATGAGVQLRIVGGPV